MHHHLLTITRKVKTNCFLKPRFANFFKVLKRIAQLGLRAAHHITTLAAKNTTLCCAALAHTIGPSNPRHT